MRRRWRGEPWHRDGRRGQRCRDRDRRHRAHDRRPREAALADRALRRTLAIIRQNIAFSLAVKALFVALTFAGYATLWGAIAADVSLAPGRDERAPPAQGESPAAQARMQLQAMGLTAPRLKVGVLALACSTWRAACLPCSRARSACASSGVIVTPIWRPGCTIACPGRSRATASSRLTWCVGSSSGS